MSLLHCLCGQAIEAPDAEALVVAYFTHTETQHPEVALSDTKRRDVADAVRRTGGWDGRREPLQPAMTIEALAPDRAADYVAFFDGDASCDNPAWASCYCISYELDMPPLSFDARTAAENRAEKLQRIERGASSGVLAYAGERVIGWCHAAPRSALPALDSTPGFACEEPATTGAIVCFVVPPQYRGQGLAARLLAGACDMLAERGMTQVEAFPPQSIRSAAGGYHGSLKLYLAAGFEQVREAGRYVVVKKTLQPSRP